MSARRGRGGNVAGTNRSFQSQLAMLKSSLHGHANALRATNPPPFTRKPFNTITVEEILAGDTLHTTGQQVTVTHIINALTAQLDTSQSTDVTIKIKRIDLWTTGVTETPSIRGKFFGLTMAQTTAGAQTVSNPLKAIEDIGTLGASAAVVSYSWPRDQADMPLNNSQLSGDQPVYEALAAATDSKTYARYHLLWCTGDPSITPSPSRARLAVVAKPQ